jgi:hypothetical protein
MCYLCRQDVESVRHFLPMLLYKHGETNDNEFSHRNGVGSHVFQHLEGEMPMNFHREMHGHRRDHKSHI